MTGPADVESPLLPDLDRLDMTQVRTMDRDALRPYLAVLHRQVERPRPNLGAGPPGRAD